MAVNTHGFFNNNGFSIIEAIVGGVFLAAAIVGLYAVISQSSVISKDTLLRKRAYQELERVMENPVYSSKSYTSVAAGTTALDTVVLDDRGALPDLKGGLSVTVASVSYTANAGNMTNGGAVPGKKITATITWTDGGATYAESLEKVITFVGF